MEKGCDYCQGEKVLFQRNIPVSIGFDNKINWHEDVPVFIDRGRLRMVEKDDSMCLDHGEKFKINYCPVCGDKIGKEG